MPQDPTVTISIVSHAQLGLIGPLLDQLDLHCHASVAKVILTINIPERDAPPAKQFRFPIERIDNAAAKGFGANHNQAFARCQTPWFLALNPDIRLAEDVVTPLLALAQSDTGVMTPRILEPGKTTPEPHRAILTPLEIFARRRADYAAPMSPAWIPGLFMLFRSQAFAAVGGFDERFFSVRRGFRHLRAGEAGGLENRRGARSKRAARRAAGGAPGRKAFLLVRQQRAQGLALVRVLALPRTVAG